MREILLNRSKFTDFLSSYSTPDDQMIAIQSLLQSIENQLADGVRLPATVKVTANAQHASYNHDDNEIIIPYHASRHGIYYYSNLCHEDRHADQTYGNRDAVEKTLLEISRAIYPPDARLTKTNGDPSNEYLYNYGELDARCAEIQAFNDAFASRIKATPPDCNIIEKDEILKVMQDTWSILRLQQSQFKLYSTRLQNMQSVLTNDADSTIMPCELPKAALFLLTTAPTLYKEKFQELQNAIQTFNANMQAVERWTSPEFRQQTQEAEHRKMQEYQEQEHQQVIQMIKQYGAHYDEFPPKDTPVEVTSLASDNVLKWYMEAHHKEADALYIVHIDVGSKEHSYIAHRVLPAEDPRTPLIPPIDKSDIESEIPEPDDITAPVVTELLDDEYEIDVL